MVFMMVHGGWIVTEPWESMWEDTRIELALVLRSLAMCFPPRAHFNHIRILLCRLACVARQWQMNLVDMHWPHVTATHLTLPPQERSPAHQLNLQRQENQIVRIRALGLGATSFAVECWSLATLCEASPGGFTYASLPEYVEREFCWPTIAALLGNTEDGPFDPDEWL